MRKNLLILGVGCLAFAYACGDASNTNNEEGGSTTSYSVEGSEMDSASGAAVSASARQSEVDTNRMDIGTDRAAGGGGAATAGNFEKGSKLIAGSDCLACHQVEKKIVGPSYTEVAQKYEFNDKNVDYLAGKIIEGGSGVWGQVPMTPHPNIPKADAQDMARYILSLRK
ncbi:c-type cytochrome [Pontibacter chinhatensis]|uniref:Cytochrome c n=1 Tax=Pontibacter chinhatensis TaxID=1436961 RepID=A0A1I2RAJ4_9BACT|nr:c-type cytochrome [Pontibacter chinhatensis]SFG37482.1 cytochrome c [Pontibacter chinhatensis]